MDVFRKVNGKWTKCEGPDDYRPIHYARISKAYDNFIATARATVTVNGETFDMQIRDIDISRLDGAIRYNELEGVTEMYLTDADDVTHYHVSLADAKMVLAEMMRVAYVAHAAKQYARAQIDAAETVAEMEAVTFGAV